ncbi:hypothetical protein ACFOMH_12480 [Paracoccus mangrovi]|uniref:Uncharacterized protein n=1 Tax=Paracoccus mangrovi TaxID=1715645 RepID=A0ABV7R474_9RHOB
MRDDLNASEKRLIAALDRIDRFLDQSAGAGRGQGDAPALAALEAELRAMRDENARLSQEMVLLHERQSAAATQYEARLAAAQDRVQALGQETAQLTAANEALAAANRALSGAAAPSGDATRGALEAEIESLRASRAAEIAQMGDIIETLDRMIGTPDVAVDAAPPAAPPAVAPSRRAPARAPAPAREPEAAVMLETPPMPREIAGQAAGGHDEDEERG